MANTVKGPVYIIDSAGVYLTSDGTATGSYMDMSISAISFYGTGSTSELGLSLFSANSTDIIHLKVNVGVGGNEEQHYAVPIKVTERVYVRQCVAGTAYLYFA